MKSYFFNLVSLLSVAALLLPACRATPAANLALSNKPRDPSPDASQQEVRTLVESDNAFAVDLYRTLSGQEGNLVYSPYSLSLALAMTYAGARGDTAAQMADVLYFALPEGRLHTTFNFLDQELTNRGAPKSKEDQPLQLKLANAVWGQQGHTFLQDYLDLLAREYGAGLRLADFANQAEPARREINGWVSDQTQGKIPELVPPGLLDAATRLVLVNAIYFKGLWENPFNPDATQEAPFHRLDSSTISVPFMSQTLSVPYAKGDGWQAVELPYQGGTAAMDLIVPDSGNFRSFEASLDSQKLETLLNGLQTASVAVSLPKFKFTSEFNLSETLSGMGMPAAFDPGLADFSGMDGQRDLYISDVLHQAFLSVDEEGTEAAAASAVAMRAAGIAQVDTTLVIDRPFIFLIRDLPSGQILFAGRLLVPES